MIPIEEALRLIQATLEPTTVVTTPSLDAVGHFLATDVRSDVDSPPHDKSVMDGFAVRSNDFPIDQPFKIVETIPAGTVPSLPLEKGEVARIMTGAPLPRNADAVVMIEKSELVAGDESKVRFSIDSVPAGLHVMQRAASMQAGEVVFEAGHPIRPTDIGLLAETGNMSVPTRPFPTVGILPTGDELVDGSEVPGPGMIRNSNGPMLYSMCRQLGAEAIYLGVGRDNEADLEAKIQQGLKSDFLILSGGVSAGMLDLVPKILQQNGVRQVFHKVKIKPGKPVWFGILDRESSPTYVFGLPGNPVSSLVGFHLFVRSAIRLWMGGRLRWNSLPARLTDSHETRGDRPTYWPARLRQDAESEVRYVTPLQWQGSSDLRALGLADSLIFFPRAGETYAPETVVNVVPI